jgi:hypothetical protein
LPPTDARIVHVPAAPKVMVPEPYEQIVVEPEGMEIVTGSPELAVAVSGSLVWTATVAGGTGDHVIVWVCCAATTEIDCVALTGA